MPSKLRKMEAKLTKSRHVLCNLTHSGGGRAKQASESGSKADQIRRTNAMKNYTELLENVDSDLKHAERSFGDVEV